MGVTADDALQSAERQQARIASALAAGAKPCPRCRVVRANSIVRGYTSEMICATCDDLGWVDADGRPCEL